MMPENPEPTATIGQTLLASAPEAVACNTVPHLPSANTRRPWSHTLADRAGNLLLLVMLAPFLALTANWVPRFLLAVAILDIPLQLGTHLYYQEKEAAVGALGGLSISATTVALTGLYLSWLIRSLLRRDLRRQPPYQINVALLMYIAINIVSLFIAQDVSLAVFEVVLLLESSLLFFYVANVVRSPGEVLFVVSCLLIGCLLESAIMIVMRVAVTPASSWNLPIHLHADLGTHGNFMRVGGTVGSPNFAAGYLSVCLALAASVLLTNLSRGYKMLAISGLGLGSVALLLTGSRGGWIALVLAVLILGFAMWRHRGLSLKMPLAAAALSLLLYLPFHSLISARVFGDDKGSAESRIPLMHLAFRIVEANPVLGVGANNFTVVMNRYLSPEFREGFLFAVHNKYLLVLAETGAIGLLAFLAFLLGTVRKGWLCWRLCDDPLSLLALGLVAGLAGHMVHMTVDVFRGRPTQQLVWLIAGLLTAMLQMRRSVSSPGVPGPRAH